MDTNRNPTKLNQALQDIVLERALVRIGEKNHGAAISLLKGLLLEFPENTEAALLLRDISPEKRHRDEAISSRNPFLGKTKDLIADFVRKYHPRHLDLLDMAWEIFRELSPADMTGRAAGPGLGFAGSPSGDDVLPKVIVMMVALTNNPPSRDDIFKAVEDVGRQAGASRELINRVAAWAVDLF